MRLKVIHMGDGENEDIEFVFVNLSDQVGFRRDPFEPGGPAAPRIQLECQIDPMRSF